MKRILLLAVLAVACEGPMGPAGKDGSGIVTVHQCLGFMPITSSGGVTANYTVYDFADGGVFVSCEIIGGALQATSVEFWRANTQEAKTAKCVVSFDVDTPSSGQWTMTMPPTSRATSFVVYSDPGSTNHNRGWVFQCTNVE